MEKNYSEEERYLKAQKKVRELSGFYWHVFSYVLVNLIIGFVKIDNDFLLGKTFHNVFDNFAGFPLWFFWGIGLFFHGVNVFKDRLDFFRGWEERKIKELMEKDNN
ncbi:hypothetical protein GGR42_002584 [Saonia flava]|uniref:2TM domain-containing protein n=1 Tax=Saonia flava TaxID=523696 RepID=A0A846R0Z3_9FLAO|nr:2TM domain-containing protein [Saonia flava]NJB72093.1 hypothetical protein [Saonia flava]